MKKGFKILYTILFLVMCTIPLILMPFIKSDAKIEKRELTKLPPFIKDGALNLGFSEQFESWYNDRLPFRSQMLSAANLIKGETLHTSTSNVIVGKEGWLYYESESMDYMNTNAMTDQEIRATAITLSLIEEDVTGRGGRFVFVPMPNKASVYGEYMPFSYRKAEENNLSLVMDQLDTYNVNYVNMLQVMTDHKEEGIYHRRDSHWNYKGAFIGYHAIMEGLGRDHDRYADAICTCRKDWRADLDKLLYPAGGFLDDQYYYEIDHADFTFTYPARTGSTEEMLENFMSDREDGDDLFSTKNSEISDGSDLYMVRDSFGRALLPYMIDSYETATFKRTDCPDLTSIPDGTDLVYEIVERNLPKVIATAPFMYAPKRDNISLEDRIECGDIEVVCDPQGYGIRIYGSIPLDTELKDSTEGEEYNHSQNEDGRVYIALLQEDTTVVYEAFPIYESKYLDGDPDGCQGFSAILPKDTGLTGSFKIEILSGNRMYSGDEIRLPEAE